MRHIIVTSDCEIMCVLGVGVGPSVMSYDGLTLMRSHHQLSGLMQNRKPGRIGLRGLRDFVIAGWSRARYLTSRVPGNISVSTSPQAANIAQ